MTPRRAPLRRASIGVGFSLRAYLRAVEAWMLADALGLAGGNRPDAARLLGVSGRQLRYLIQKHGPRRRERLATRETVADARATAEPGGGE
jgi:DNA-binding NtrC family response regulator